MRLLPLLIALSWPLAASLQAAPLPLDELLAGMPAAPALRQGDAELEALAAAADQRRAEAGWQMFGGVAYGTFRELNETDRADDYDGGSMVVGVRHPLLGTLYRRMARVHAGRHEQERQRLRLALLRAEYRWRLRGAYADWWRDQEQLRLCRPAVEAAERALPVLETRRRAGWMLGSEAELLRTRWQGLQRRCAGARAHQQLSGELLGELSGRPVAPTSQARAESLLGPPKPLKAWLQALEGHPRLADRQDRLAEARQQAEVPLYAALDSNISFSRSFEQRSSIDSTGNAWVASLDVSAPFDVFDYGDAQRREGEARYRAAQAALEDERQQMHRALATALRTHRRALEDLRQLRDREAAARQRSLEQRLRGNLDGEAGLARRQEAELELHETALQRLEAWHALWLSDASLRVFGEDAPAAAELFGGEREVWQGEPGEAEAPGEWSEGVYIWDSRALLDARRGPRELRRLRKAGMQRLYVGLSGEQIGHLAETRAQLQRLLHDAGREGMETVLLLGDPAWLQPGQRGGLIELVQSLADLPFAALHLDLEVEQLGWPVPPQRLAAWLDTLGDVARHSPWPLELSSHHRWFAADAGGVCVPCALPRLGVRQVSLMIYTSNVERSATLAGDIARRWPALRFRLAQSVEPQLPREESLAGRSRAQLKLQAARWKTQLQPASLAGIDWQAWTYYPR